MMDPKVEKFVEKFGRLPTEFDSDYLEMLRMSKYRILDVPDKQPGKCSNCGSSKNDGRKYIDFGLYVDWYGTVHICTHCLKDIARNAGIFDELEEELKAAYLNLQRFEDLKNQGAELHETVVRSFNDLEGYYAGLHSLGNDSASDSSSNVEPEPAPEVEPGISESEPRTTKPTDGARRKNIRSLTELLDNPGN